MLSTTFGTRCPRYVDSAASKFFSIQRDFDAALSPGAHPPIDLVPLLQYVPSRWAPWKAICRDLNQRQKSFYFELMENCERRIDNGKNNGCFLDGVITDRENSRLTREMIA